MEHVHFGRGKLPGTNTSLKKHIKLRKGSAVRLRQAKVGVDDAQETDATLVPWSADRYLSEQRSQILEPYPEESGIVAPVPSGRVEHIRRQDAVDDANDVAIRPSG